MKILHVDTEKSWRGGEQQLLYLVKGLSERDCLSVVACRKGAPLEERCREAGVETLPLSGNQLADTVRLALAAKKYDVVHAHAANGHTIAVLSRMFHGRPVLYTRRVDYIPKAGFLTRRKYRATDRVIAITESVREILSRYGVPVNRLRVIYSSVDDHYGVTVDDRRVEEIRGRYMGMKIVGTVGALTEQKNHVNFIDAAKRALDKREDLVFLIIGEGHLRPMLSEKIKDEGLEGKVLLTGFKKDVQNYLKALDVFVLSSDYEGMGSILLAAMVLGVPVVSTDAGGAGEIVRDGETGLLVPKRNPPALAEAMLRICFDEGLRGYITAQAKENVKNRFLVSRMVNDYLELYNEILK